MMAFTAHDRFTPFEQKVWLSTPTMHGEELRYMTEAYETNWMSTVGENINEVERIAAEKAEVKYRRSAPVREAGGGTALRKAPHQPRRACGAACVLLRHDL